MKHVVILCGGVSEEHEISLLSAKNILNVIDKSLFSPHVVTINKKNEWHYHPDPYQFYNGGEAKDISIRQDLAHKVYCRLGKNQIFFENADKPPLPFDILFPILHGPNGEDGRLQAFLEMSQIPYVGSNSLSSQICMEKYYSKMIVGSLKIPYLSVTPYVLCQKYNKIETREIDNICKNFGLPLFVKASNQGSSIGIFKVTRPGEIDNAIEAAFRYSDRVLIEKGIIGREFECAILGSDTSVVASKVGEIIPHPKVGWYSYEAKYILDDGAITKTPASIEKNLEERIQHVSQQIFLALGCYGMARVDFFYEPDTDTLYFNEINTIPGFTNISLYPKLLTLSGYSQKDIVSQLIFLGLKRNNHNSL